ncbi:PQQ-binding-like beta-propeller repeat protein [Labilibaculum sp.]|uniref:outer membrane protein assembly factor BamB family protein n=1 Tax=Labilibaculum sp. TaxID=2060723 RepID=UPI002AA87E1A|nr:PQQ-binding-like beta-propeller repeat protein [Labilibaculum sp.]MBN2597707.1 PQQ-binding-like beta-propeller repeat protein [Marinifilaceae bacterium]
MNRLLFVSIALLSVLTQCKTEIQKSEWRGPNRSGVYEETGLLKEWPEEGPKMLWHLDSIPTGYSSAAIAHNTVYLTGLKDSMDYLVAINMEGKLKWQIPYGRGWDASFVDSRCTPTIEDERIYLSSGRGDLACVNALSGELIWQKKANEIFEGECGEWGISESLLLYKDLVFYTPCGKKTTMIALNKMTGETVWESKSLDDKSAYVSPLLIDRNGKKQIVTVTENNAIGVNPENGNIDWQFDYGSYAAGEWKANINTNTPLYKNGKIFITNGYDHHSVMLDLNEEASEVELSYVDSLLDVHHGGAVLLDGYIYGANWINNRNGYWVCMEWETGKKMYETEWENKGSIISAEGMLYCYDEKDGNVALVKADPKEFKVISSFKVPYGKGPYWAHMVINNGVLYVRHATAIMAYSIKIN